MSGLRCTLGLHDWGSTHEVWEIEERPSGMTISRVIDRWQPCMRCGKRRRP